MSVIDKENLHHPSLASDNLEDNEAAVDNVVELEYKLHRIFINHVDSYHSKYISAYITDQIYGKPLDFGEGGGGAEDDITNADPFAGGDVEQKNYEFIGTLSAPFNRKTEDILYTIDENDTENFMQEIMKCGVIIYDITNDVNEIPKALTTLAAIQTEMEKIKDVGPKTFTRFPEIKKFVLLSTVMTWAQTKVLDPDDPEFAFAEEDYKKRKPHPNYKEHIDCEKEVVRVGKLYPEKLKTYVICSGITYGQEEDDLLFYFKLAWYNEKYLPLFQNGNNFIPLINVRDLAKVIYSLIATHFSCPPLILAVEQTPTTLEKIVGALAKHLGQNKMKNVTIEEAFLYKEMKQKIFDRITVNLRMAPNFIETTLQIDWENGSSNLPELIPKMVEEFRLSRNLLPLKIVIHGPPASGRTTLARKFCEHYGLHYVAVDDAIKETIADLQGDIEYEKERLEAKRLKAEEMALTEEPAEEAVEEEEEEETGPSLEEMQETLKEILQVVSSEYEVLPEEFVIKLIKNYLTKNRCQNQGYVLDGYPETNEQAKALFGGGGSGDDGEEAAGEEERGDSGINFKLRPDYVIALQATDEFLCQRLMKLPEEVVCNTRYAEEAFIKRLHEFRQNNTEDNTVVDYFDENEIHPILINVEEDKSEYLDKTFCRLIERFGTPKGFGLTNEEKAELLRLQEEETRLKAEKAALARAELEKKAAEEYTRKMEQWSKTLEQLQMEEEKILVAESEPMRHYLMKFIFPVLTRGLIEVAKVKPSDPLDYLAEFLFKQNEEGLMFDPAYTRSGSMILDDCKELMDAVLSQSKILSEPDSKI